MILLILYINVYFIGFFSRIYSYKISTLAYDEKPRFYVNKDTFSNPSVLENPVKQFGRDENPYYTLSPDRLKELLPSESKTIDSFLDFIGEYHSLHEKHKQISVKIGEIKKKLGENSCKTEEERESYLKQIEELKKESIKLSRDIVPDKTKKRILNGLIGDAYYKIPNKKMINVPETDPTELNSYKRDFIPKDEDSDTEELDFDEERPSYTHDKVLKVFSNMWESSISRMFSIFSGDLTVLENALIQYLMDVNRDVFGFIPSTVPCFVKNKTMYKTGHLPKFADNVYEIKSNDESKKYSLIPSAELSLLEMIHGNFVSPKILPLKLVSHTQCFRNEDVGYGSQNKGIIRQNQFSKVELLVVTDDKSSSYWQSLLVSQVEFLLRSLGLEYNTVLLPENETPHTSACTVDVNVYFPASDKYIEISSISNTLDYQSCRLGLHCTGFRERLHILNASAFPIGRLLSCILEAYQFKSYGVLKIKVPDCLVQYTHKKVLEPIVCKTKANKWV